ncbi:MAG: hypothetical protein AABZ47_11070 [Planctomycetota bacterium]
MAKPFDLRKQFKLHDKGLLRRLFAEHGESIDFSCDSLLPHRVEPLINMWEAIPEVRRRQVEVILRDVNELGDERGHRVLTEELIWRCADKMPDFAGPKSLLDKALWAYLEAPSAFNEAAIFARAEALRSGQFAYRWNGLPVQTIEVNEAKIAALQNEVHSFYWKKELRGEHCRVHHYSRSNGAEYFFAYLPDWPDKCLIFDTEGNLTPREESYTFTNVFIYVPSEGAIELIAKGGKKVHLPLRKAFCKAVLDIDVDGNALIRPTYRLDHLIDPNFAFCTEPMDRVNTVRLRRIRLVPKIAVPGVEHLEIKFVESAKHADAMTEISGQLETHRLAGCRT